MGAGCGSRASRRQFTGVAESASADDVGLREIGDEGAVVDAVCSRVTVGVSIGHSAAAGANRDFERVDRAAVDVIRRAVEVGITRIAGIANPVQISVSLQWVGVCGAVIAGVADAVAVRVGL